jgi:hypothetical protein
MDRAVTVSIVVAAGVFGRCTSDRRDSTSGSGPDDLVQVRVGAFPPREFLFEQLERFLRLFSDFAFVARFPSRRLGGGGGGGVPVRDFGNLANARLELLLLREQGLTELTRQLHLLGLGAEVRLESIEQRGGSDGGRGRVRPRRCRV